MASVLPYPARTGLLSRQAPSLAAVLVLHLLLGWALVTGLARKVIEVVKAPIETKIIEEIKKAPDLPPPPPPKLAPPPPPFIPPPEINIQAPQVQAQPTITTVTTTRPPAPQVIAPPAAPPKPATPPVRKEFKAAYRVEPQFPRQALRHGLDGRVVAHVYVEPAGNVSDVKIVSSSNHMFDGEVVRALSQWRFNPEPVGFIGEYEIVFKLKD